MFICHCIERMRMRKVKHVKQSHGKWVVGIVLPTLVMLAVES